MRRIISICAIIAILLTACGKSEESYEALDAEDAFLMYPANNVISFTVDDEGALYAYGDDFNTITVYALDGEKTDSYQVDLIDYGIIHMCIGNKIIYFDTMVNETYTIFSYDTETGAQKELITLDNFAGGYFGVKKLEYANERLYIMGIDPSRVGMEYDLWEGDFTSLNPFVYDGSVLAAFDVKTGELETVFDDIPDNFSITPDGKIMLYAYDSKGGNYFAVLDPADYSLSDKTYFKLDYLMKFAADHKNNIVVFPCMNRLSSFYTLSYVSLQDGGITDIMPNVEAALGIVYRKGFIFYQNSLNNNKIERIKNSVYVKDNPKIKMIATNVFTTDTFSAGYNIEFSTLDYDEYALTVLSRDKKYDVSYMSSRQDFASNIKDKGSFYPLNDVPGVQEFIDACFPFIQNATTDEDGNIWMLPISVNADVFVYNEDNCINAGIDIHNIHDVYDILNIVLKEHENESKHFDFNSYAMRKNSLALYMRGNTTLDTPEFRKLAPLIKTLMAMNESSLYHDALLNFVSEKSTEFTFYGSFVPYYPEYLIRNDLKAAPLTGTGSKNPADCVFLCVNPDSDNLDATLGFISALCNYMLTEKNLFLFADPSKYTDSSFTQELYHLFENSVINFNFSNEIFLNDFERYLRDEITLDALIAEGDRKLAMYRGE